jgi:parallel beta helix pectate lyase-like protein
MASLNEMELNRRDVLRAASGLVAGAAWLRWAGAEELPPVTKPRATSGDTAVEPAWDETLTVTVGPDKGDLCGASDKVIQAALDYVAGLGGGTVHVLPGTYTLRNSVFLRPGVRLLGSGLDSVLVKAPMVETTLAADSDWYDQEITLADASGFEVGDGVCLQTDNPHHGGREVLKRTLVARSGNRFKLDKALRKNFWTMKTPSVSSLFPLLTAEESADMVIENITIDGNRDNNGHLNGNYSGGIWLQDCSRVAIRKVVSRNNNSDGMSWQIGHDILVEECHCHDNADLGLHPGSGSQRPLMRGNTLERNKIGIFFCWGVKYGLAEKNTIRDSLDTGLSIGHRDNENLIRDNDITGSGKTGVLFRPERGEGFTARENRLEDNRIIDNGPEDGIAVDVQGHTETNTLTRNIIRETRAPASRIGIRLGKDAGPIELADNTIEGFATDVEDLREA